MQSNRFFNRLSVRLTAAFLLSAVAGVVLIAFLTYNGTANGLRSYIGQVQAMQGMMGGIGSDMMEGMNSQPALTFMSNLARTLWIAGILGAVLALFLGALFTRHIMAPLGEVTTAAKRVARGESLKPVIPRGTSELAELGDSFNTMADTINRDREVRQNMMADIAHELRTPLAVLQANIEAMQDGVIEKTPENLGTLHQETLLLARLVEDLRTLSLAESGQLKIRTRVTDMGKLTSQIVDAIRPQFASKKIGLTIRQQDHLPSIEADPDRIEQVVRNLITNSLHYTPEGGSVTVNLESDREGVTTSVSDTGPGIAPEDLQRLFDRFYRVDRSRSRSTGGSGLGLAIVKQLVEAHGGRVWATSQVGKGSTFSFRLPTSPTGA